MYSSRGSNNAYGQDQPYSSQSSYAPQSLAAASLLGGAHVRPSASATAQPPQHYGGGEYNPVYGSATQQLAAASLLGGAHGRPSASATAQPPQHYGGREYNPVYGSATQQISPLGKGTSTTAFEGRSNYGKSMPESPKFTVHDYVSSSSRGYGQKVNQLYSDRPSDYPSVERHQYADCHGAYLGRELPSETANRYTESVAFGHGHQSKIYDRLDQATVLRQEEMLNARAIQSASIDGEARQANYLAARAPVRHPAQDPTAYGGRLDPEVRSLSMLTGPSYGGNHSASILGAAPRNLDDLIYTHTSSNPGYGVSLPPGRDYGARKGLHGISLESDYPAAMLGSHLILGDRKDDRATYGRDLERRNKDLDYLREREKDREQEKDRLRERERERERERDRERQREREREREREKERERREKERDREHKRRLELKRELTPPRALKDRRASSLAKDVGSLRRESPRREVLHRHHSPVKEKRRDYSCKVFPFSFVEAKRDFLSLDKRYPRLYVAPECSKVVVNWPRKNLRLSLNTPISFEHDFVEAAVVRKESPSTQPTADISGTGVHTTVWNAKIILMSGLGQNSQADLSSERTYNDRIPHFCNLLRFAILKKNSSLIAIGGPWSTVDGGDPSVDDSSLVQTALRYAKDLVNLDLKNCRHWNRFIEIHYDRIGKDGLFSHKEVTVLYVPDLSDCLPSLDSWREQWSNHKKAVSERERLHALTKEVPGDKKEVQKDKKKLGHSKDSKVKTEVQKKKEASVENKESAVQYGEDSRKKESDANKLKGKESLVSAEVKEKDKEVENKDVIESTEQEKNDPEKVEEGKSDSPTAVVAKTGKKRIVKRIVKRKIAKKKDATENAIEKNDVIEKPSTEGNNIISEVDGSSSNPPAVVKTFVRKKVVKKPMNDAAVEKDESSILEVKPDLAPESAVDKEKVKSEDSNAVVQEGIAIPTKTTVKKKVIKRVPKRKTLTSETVAEDDVKGENMIQPEDVKVEQNQEVVEKQVNEVKPDKKEEPKADNKEIYVSAMETDSTNQKASQDDNLAKSKEKKELKDEKERKERENVSKSKTSKTEKEKKKSDGPPKHPGFILQTKGSKAPKLQSLSLSLDSLLGYSDKDIEESTFELSVFAETFHEMLQYDMGCRLLAFLQKLRIKFVTKRNKGKRKREESSKKENEESASKKHAKSGNANEDVQSSKTEDKSDITGEDKKSTKTEIADDAPQNDSSKAIKEETKSDEQVDTALIEDEIEEDPEEDPEEDEQMPGASPHHDSAKEENTDAVKTDGDSVGQGVAPTGQNEKQEAVKETPETISTPDPSNKDKLSKVESKPKEAPRVVNKELLQAFRFFDRNRVGYIRVEDLRLIIHNLGKFLSHRDVKELVQSALLESNTGRDDRILYEKLVKM